MLHTYDIMSSIYTNVYLKLRSIFVSVSYFFKPLIAITILFYLPVQSVKEKLVLVSRSLGQSSPTGRTDYRVSILLVIVSEYLSQ